MFPTKTWLVAALVLLRNQRAKQGPYLMNECVLSTKHDSCPCAYLAVAPPAKSLRPPEGTLKNPGPSQTEQCPRQHRTHETLTGQAKTWISCMTPVPSRSRPCSFAGIVHVPDGPQESSECSPQTLINC